MALINAKLITRIKRTPSTESFRFLAEEKINFIPGQFLQVIFDPDNLSNKELNKYLSFSCAPQRDYIEVTKRLSESRFSQALRNLKTGDEISLNAPLGTCVFKEEDRKITFLIGGIGITPVISIVEYIVEKKLATDICLIYSNRTEEEIAFKEELDYWQSLNKNLKISYLVTDCQPKDKSCIFGRINKDFIGAKICDLAERILFIFGPPKMVEAMQALSLEAGAKQENLRIENFVGY
jgi:ferredoxin-NADP reductase